MNAPRIASTRMSFVGRRLASSGIPLPKIPVPKIYHKTFKDNWLTDPSAYPLLIIMTFAASWTVGMAVNCLRNNEDVHISPKYRRPAGPIRPHGYERNGKTVTAKFALHEGLTGPEGLGVDHDEWVQNKHIEDPLVHKDTHHKTLYHPHWLP